jgi:hypothetical protein
MAAKTIIELPEFDTGQYEGREFLMKAGNATLTLQLSELAPVIIQFQRVRWHQFISQYLCGPEWPKASYFKLIEIAPSEKLAEFVAKDPRPPYKELRHYRIFLDGTGGHEVFAESCCLSSANAVNEARLAENTP